MRGVVSVAKVTTISGVGIAAVCSLDDAHPLQFQSVLQYLKV